MSAKPVGPGRLHTRPSGLTDDTVQAVGKVTEALEWVERARGHLYEFHHQMGHADLLLGEGASNLESLGQSAVATRLRRDCIGLDALDGRWTFEIVEEFDDGYYDSVKRAEAAVRSELIGGSCHVGEAEMKQAEQASGR